MIRVPFSIASGSYHPKCPDCDTVMFSMTEYGRALCKTQHGIDETFLCLECEVKDELKEYIRDVLLHPSGPSCSKCNRYGLKGCCQMVFLEEGSDNCYTTGERNLAVRLDCQISGDAHPLSRIKG